MKNLFEWIYLYLFAFFAGGLVGVFLFFMAPVGFLAGINSNNGQVTLWLALSFAPGGFLGPGSVYHWIGRYKR